MVSCLLRLGDFPADCAYLSRPHEDNDMHQAGLKLQSSIGGACLVVLGKPGVGKSSLVANFVASYCGGERVVWFNVASFLANNGQLQLADNKDMPPTFQRFLSSQLKTPVLGFDDEEDDDDSKYLLIFDELDSPASMKFVVKILVSFGSESKSIVVASDDRCLAEVRRSCREIVGVVKVDEFGLEERKRMIRPRICNRFRVNENQVKTLASVCGGLPATIAFIDRLIDRVGFANIVHRLLLANAKVAHGSTNNKGLNEIIASELLTTYFGETNFSLDDDSLARRFFYFLLFPAGQSVDALDLALLWNCEIAEAVSYCCEHFVAINLVKRLIHCRGEISSNVDNIKFAVGSLFHAAALDYANHRFGEQVFSNFLRSLVKKGARKHPKRRCGENLLHVAIRLRRYQLAEMVLANCNDSEIVQLLLKKSSDDRVTPLFLLFLAYEDDETAVVIDLALKISQRVAAICGKNWLMMRRRRSILAKIRYFLQNGKLCSELSLLECAVEKGLLDLVKALLRDVSDRPDQEAIDRALIRAVTNQDQEVVKLLLENGASPEASSPSGSSVLMQSVIARNPEIAKLLLEKSANPNTKEAFFSDTALMEASRNGEKSIANSLLAHRAHPDMRNRHGETALMMASGAGHRAVVELLLLCNADPNARDNRGRTALMRAAEKGHVKTAELLLEHKVDPNILGQLPNLGAAKCTALSLAISNGHIAVARLLLQKGANSRADSRLGIEALTAAVRSRNMEAVTLLLQQGIDVNAILPEGRTMLMLAAQTSDYSSDFVRILLEINANANKVDCHGETALSYCFRNYVANPLSRQNNEKLHLLLQASCCEVYRGVWLNSPQRPQQQTALTAFFKLTHSVTRLEKLSALRVRQLLGAGFVRDKVANLSLPSVLKDIIQLLNIK